MSITISISEESYHPSYSRKDASLILSSKDGIKFRVHPVIIKVASEVFNDFLSGTTDTGSIIEIPEKSDILKSLMDCIYPDRPSLHLTPLHEIDFVWKMLLAAEKYKFTSILEEYRIRIVEDVYFKEIHPLESYAIACRFSWDKEIYATSLRALDEIDSYNSSLMFEHVDVLHFVRLQRLLMIRKRQFSEKLRKLDIPDIAWLENCIANDYHSVLYSVIELDFWKNPSGKTLQQVFWEQDEVAFLLNLDGIKFMRSKIRTILNDLPLAVTGSKAHYDA